MPVDLGAFAQGHEAGLDRQAKQEQLKMQKQAFEQQRLMGQQTMDMNDLKMQDLQNKLDAQTRLNIDSQRSDMRNNISKMFDSGNPVELNVALEAVNESPVLKGKTLRSANTEEDMTKTLKYMDAKGYSSDNLYVIDEETGKPRPPVGIGPNAEKERQEAEARVQEENMFIAQELINKGQLVVNSDGQLVGIEDIAAITGQFQARPSDQIKNDQILAGIRAKLSDVTASTRRPTNIEEKQRILRESLTSKGLVAGSEEYQEAYNEGLEQIRRATVEGVGGVRDVKVEDAITKGTMAWTDYTTTGAEIDKEEALRDEVESDVRKTTGYKDVMKVVRDTKQVLKLATDINKDLASMDSKEAKREAELMRGPIENLQTWGSKFFSYEDQGAVWDDETVERIKATFPVNTKLGMLVQQYVKSISGATVTDAERDFFMKTLTGGDMADPDILRSTLGTFQEVVAMRQRSNIDDLGNMGASYTAFTEEQDIPANITDRGRPQKETYKVGDTDLEVVENVSVGDIDKVFRVGEGVYGVRLKDGTNIVTRRNPYGE